MSTYIHIVLEIGSDMFLFFVSTRINILCSHCFSVFDNVINNEAISFHMHVKNVFELFSRIEPLREYFIFIQ